MGLAFIERAERQIQAAIIGWNPRLPGYPGGDSDGNGGVVIRRLTRDANVTCCAGTDVGSRGVASGLVSFRNREMDNDPT